MERWGFFISIVSGVVTILGLVGIFVKIGSALGSVDAEMKEMRKDIDGNQKDINALGSKVNQMQIENTRLISTLSSDLGWIKASLADIKTEVQKKKE
ncbi:MAG: hypothetical protein IK015_04585 [Treponema sp.]|nr:hypothetical protein [Treponema sp.]